MFSRTEYPIESDDHEDGKIKIAKMPFTASKNFTVWLKDKISTLSVFVDGNENWESRMDVIYKFDTKTIDELVEFICPFVQLEYKVNGNRETFDLADKTIRESQLDMALLAEITYYSIHLNLIRTSKKKLKAVKSYILTTMGFEETFLDQMIEKFRNAMMEDTPAQYLPEKNMSGRG